MHHPHLFHPHLFLLLSSVLALFGTMPARAQLGISWITQFGTNQQDRAQAIVVDALGQSWVVGYTGANLGGSYGGGVDFFLTRLSAGGSVDFHRQRGSSGSDFGYGVAVVGGSTVFAGGYTFSSGFDSQPALGEADALLVRYDTSGTYQATTRFGTATSDILWDLAGNATHLLAAGYTSVGFDSQSIVGGQDAFLTKRTSTGAVVWTRLAGTASEDSGEAATFDSAGNGYVAGYTRGSFTGFINAGSYDLFVARYDSAGNQTLLQQLGTDVGDFASDVEVDVSGNIYLSGRTSGNLGGQTSGGNLDGFLMKLDSSGNVLWTRLIGGTNLDVTVGLGLDGLGHVWVAGYSYGGFGDHTGDDSYVAQYDTEGNLLGTVWLGTGGGNTINGLAVGPDGAAYVTGSTLTALGGPSAGSEDAFVARITGVPEPGSALLLAGAGAGLLARRRRLGPAVAGA
jgi:hypothetical protein